MRAKVDLTWLLIIGFLLFFMGLAMTRSHAQYYPTPAEQISPIVRIFAWNEQDQLAVWTALEAIKGTPGIDNLLIGRAIRIQEKMKTRGIVWVGAHGETWLPPVQLTLPEMILSGFALSRYYCRAEEQDIDQEQAQAYCDKANAKAQSLVGQIAAIAGEHP